MHGNLTTPRGETKIYANWVNCIEKCPHWIEGLCGKPVTEFHKDFPRGCYTQLPKNEKCHFPHFELYDPEYAEAYEAEIDFSTYDPNWRLKREKCAICGGSVDEDGYAECEECGKFFCAAHNNNKSGFCPDCVEKVMEEAV